MWSRLIHVLIEKRREGLDIVDRLKFGAQVGIEKVRMNAIPRRVQGLHSVSPPFFIYI